MDTTKIKRAAVNGTELAYVEQGEGDPVVLIHGSLDDLRSWAGQIAALASRYRVIVPSRRYHWPNATPDPDARYANAEHVDDLAAFIETLGIAPARLVGSSYGALTALTLAATRPGLAHTLVLGEPPLFPWLDGSGEGPALRAAFLAEAWQPAGEAARRGDTEAMVRLFLDGVIGPGTFDRIPPPGRAEMLENAQELAIELRTQPVDLFPDLTCDDVSRIDVPVLLLGGEVSPRMFAVVQDALARCLPAVERATIRDASHAMHADNHEAYSETILAFLARQ